MPVTQFKGQFVICDQCGNSIERQTGTQKRCVPCRPAAAREKSRRWRAANPDAVRNQSIGVKRNSHLRQTYGISLTKWEALWDAQEGCCGLCACPLPADAHTDHDHLTGKIRALLCRRCNIGLGYHENTQFAQQAKEYLVRHACS